VVNKEREQLWLKRIAHWQESGMSMRAYALEHGFPVRQVGYWVRRLMKVPTTPALLPVRITPAVAAAATTISLRSERGWTLSLPGDVSAAWLAELMRSL
jgi:hypothetical protein